MIRPVATLPPKERDRLAPPGESWAPPEPVDDRSPRQRQPPWFVAVELLLLLAVPVLGYFGAQALLSTTAGTFTAQPLPGEPGWRVLVDPSPVIAVAEVLDDRLTGVTLVAQPGEESPGGVLVMVPAELELADGRRLNELVATDALAALSAELRLGFSEVVVVSAGDWPSILGDAVYEIGNPDPIPGAGGLPAIEVGPVEIDASTASMFLGSFEAGANPQSLLYRRQLFWQAVLDAPPTVDNPVATVLASVAGGTARVETLPIDADGSSLALDAEGAETLIREIVPLPSGSAPGDRIVIRIVDRSGDNDTQALALWLGARGYEVSEIANADPFGTGPTQLVVPSLIDIDAMRELAADLGADTVSPDPVEETDDSTVVLLVGSDIDLGN